MADARNPPARNPSYDRGEISRADAWLLWLVEQPMAAVLPVFAVVLGAMLYVAAQPWTMR